MEIKHKSFGECSHEVGKKIERYFNANIIGSVLFVDADLLKYGEIHDIDILTKSASDAYPIRAYLNDEGWVETKRPQNSPTYARVEGSFVFTKDLHIPIHVNYQTGQNNIVVLPIEQIVAEKFKRGSNYDIAQLHGITARMKRTDEK
ncbi:hypothetical protein M1M30_gp184 [Maribacter phage Colly_1]|uniref:Uncharacterized protein n=1 Tax=Maribacter phage Colly_1 TaxID=2745691 RepID=A0A8E4UXY6_9CAUD|nr:hypothetical protein M1M30_gp184 [Maribacter phage Colly_1]QQO97289.1 hypothetical protein Colly1_184 [Maribacter phage Colly_1]